MIHEFKKMASLTTIGHIRLRDKNKASVLGDS